MPSSARRPTIVVGYDGSEISRAAVTFAARRAGRHGRVYVVHAYDLPPDFLGAPNYDSLLVARQDHGLELLDALPPVARPSSTTSAVWPLTSSGGRPPR
jgi:nucleotide-binding universal stress UspA family protein